VLERDGRRVVIALEGSVIPLLRFLADRDDIVDLLLSAPRLEDIFLGYYDTSQNGSGEDPMPLPRHRLPQEATRR